MGCGVKADRPAVKWGDGPLVPIMADSITTLLDAEDLVSVLLTAAAPESFITFPLVSKSFCDAERRCRHMLWPDDATRTEFIACYSRLRERERTYGRSRAWLDGHAEVIAIRRATSARLQSGFGVWLCSASTIWTRPWARSWKARASSAFADVSAMLDALAPRRFCVLITGLRGAGKSAVMDALARTPSLPQRPSATLDREPQPWPATANDLGNRGFRVQVSGAELMIDELPMLLFGETVDSVSPRLHLCGADAASADRYVRWKLPQFDAVVYVASAWPASDAAPEWHMLWDPVLGRHVPHAQPAAATEHADARNLATLLALPELRELPLLVLSPRQDDAEHAVAPSTHLGALGLLSVTDRPWRLQGSSAHFKWTDSSGRDSYGELRQSERPPSGVCHEGIDQGFEWLVGTMRSHEPGRLVRERA